MMIHKNFRKTVAVFLLCIFVFDVLSPTVSYALTSGPSQPEFSSFEPVATTNMVNEFTGDFTYNLPLIEVPGPHGSGYAMSLSYHSGASPEEEASWVGYGWTLNPGAINRNTRGFPDDYNGAEVRYHNKMPNNWTATVGASVSSEAFSFGLPFNASRSLRYNTYKGFGYNAGIGIKLGNGVVNLGYNISNGEGSFSLNINPMEVVSKLKKKAKQSVNDITEELEEMQEAKNHMNKSNENAQKKAEMGSKFLGAASAAASSYMQHSLSAAPRATNVPDYVGSSVNVSVGSMPTLSFLQIGPSADLFGSLAVQLYTDNRDLDAHGYLYSSNSDENDIMDYYIEKESAYDKRDVFLGIPFNNADYFSVSGESLVGGFRLHHQKTGHFKPNRLVSETAILNVGGEIEAGANWGGGGDIGVGFSAITTRGWEKEANDFSSYEEDRNSVFFRFSNDRGGSWLHPSGDDLLKARISGGGVPGAKNFNARIPNGAETMNNGGPPGRSSFIGYNINREIDDAKSGNEPYKLYSHRDDVYQLAKQARSLEPGENADGIGELTVVNETGSRYTYALPVYSRDEKNLQHGLQKAPSSAIEHNFLAYYKDDKTKLGEEREVGYATTYLLTEITTPDYIDRTFNGPTQDDIGGYTRFNYVRHAGGSNASNWYKWRMPYTGLSYSRNSMSDPRDDLGSYSEGEKEIYYLQSIETKTHAAVFVTEDRQDGIEAGENALSSRSAKGTTGLKRLTKIDIYPLSSIKRVGDALFPRRGAKPLKTVHFDHDYSLVPGVPNSSSGKLTLKKVWFEYEGIAEARISPYRFDYTYNNAIYPARYTNIRTELDQLNSTVQNPGYVPFNIDAWGNHQANGTERFDSMRQWVDQKDGIGFDPAAWQLKTITLPSGGQIHVQYEQDDYSYVQDQPAHAMVRLDAATNLDVDSTKFFLNTNDDLDITSTELGIMRDLIHERYVKKREKLYFKFLYKLMNAGTPSLKSCNSEYITGYVDVSAVGIDAVSGKLFIQLHNDEKRLPRQVCKDFVLTQRIGNLNTTGDCDASSVGIDPQRDPISIIKQLGNMAKSIAVPGILCKDINKPLSYFRVPLPVSKKGGGIRVKRLLMYDQGLENDPVLYGNEYFYEFNDPLTGTIRSSGIAANEPPAIREENILVGFIAKEKQTWLNRIIAGRDKEQSEGPLGESIMPAASVGYSQVAIKNIHSGVANTGFSVKQFYTAYDYPFEAEYTGIEDKKDYLPMPGGLINVFINNAWLSQGFRFKVNNMHGQLKRDANYTGIYSPSLQEAVAVTEQEYHYFQPGEKVPVSSDLVSGVRYEDPGKEIDVTFADKAVIEEQYDGNVEFDASVGIIPFFPIPIIVPQASVAPSLTHTRTGIYTHATSKVIRYPAIIKEVISRQDGIEHHQVNLAFDKFTGEPVSVLSYDEFKGSYLNQTIPAAWEYDNFGPIANEEGKNIEAAMAYTREGSEERLYFTDGESCQLLAEFTKGDLLEIGDGIFYHVQDFDFLRDEIIIVPSKGNKNTPGASFPSVKVLRSGNNNRLTEPAGEITFHSTSTNISLPNEDDATRWTSNSFTDSLNAAIATRQEFVLTGPFNNMNMTSYMGSVPSGCNANLRQVTTRNMSFIYFNREGSMNLYLLSFEMDCGNNNWITVDPNSL